MTWLVGGNLVDEQSESSNGYIVENRLVWPAVARHDLGSAFTCRAVNSRLIEPRDANVKLDLYCKLNLFFVSPGVIISREKN